MKKVAFKTIACVFSGIAFIALGISIWSICVAMPRYQLDFDYLGFLVGLTTLLVALTVGWQIYTIVDTKNTIETQNKRIARIERKIDSIENFNNKCFNTNRIETFTAVGQAMFLGGPCWSAVPFLLISLQQYDPDNDSKNAIKALEVTVKALKDLLPNLKSLYPDHYTLEKYGYSSSAIKIFKQAIYNYGDEDLIKWSHDFVPGQD